MSGRDRVEESASVTVVDSERRRGDSVEFNAAVFVEVCSSVTVVESLTVTVSADVSVSVDDAGNGVNDNVRVSDPRVTVMGKDMLSESDACSREKLSVMVRVTVSAFVFVGLLTLREVSSVTFALREEVRDEASDTE